MTKQEMDYLNELAWKLHGIKDDFQRAVYFRSATDSRSGSRGTPRRKT